MTGLSQLMGPAGNLTLKLKRMINIVFIGNETLLNIVPFTHLNYTNPLGIQSFFAALLTGPMIQLPFRFGRKEMTSERTESSILSALSSRNRSFNLEQDSLSTSTLHDSACGSSVFEYVELSNQLAIDVDLSNWKLDGDVSFDFSDGTVLGGSDYLVLATDPSALPAATGDGTAIALFSDFLSNSGKPVILYNNRPFSTAVPDAPTIPPEKLWSVDLLDDGNKGNFGNRTRP